MKPQKARILRVFCCSLCVLGRLEAPKARVLRVFCGLEAKNTCFTSVVWSGGARAVQRCAQGAPLKEGWKPVEARMSLGGACGGQNAHVPRVLRRFRASARVRKPAETSATQRDSDRVGPQNYLSS